MIKYWLNSIYTFKAYVVIYSSFHMWFNLLQYVVQHSQWLISLFIFSKTIYVENLRHNVIDETYIYLYYYEVVFSHGFNMRWKWAKTENWLI